jgi:predicted GH43/DUF377 family glycosyl hydrolase
MRIRRRRVAIAILALAAVVIAVAPLAIDSFRADTSAGWSKDPSGPVIGGADGTCFDVDVMRDGDVYRAWFSWRPKRSIAYVESADGIHWSAPIVVLGPTDSGWEGMVNRPSVVKTATGFAMWYSGQNGTSTAIGYATSPDGINWTRHGSEPVFAAESGWEHGTVMNPDVMYDANKGLYRMWYAAGDDYEPNAIGYATSPDGVDWTRDAANPIFTGDGSGFDAAKVAGPDVVPDGTRFVMFYIGYTDENHAAIGLARSPDGVGGWTRSPDPIISHGHPFSWDSDAVYKPSALHENGRWVLWYNGRAGSSEQIGRAVHAGDDPGRR